MLFTESGFDGRFAVVEELVQQGCTFEGATPRYIALDVPPECNVDELRERLEGLQKKGLLEFKT